MQDGLQTTRCKRRLRARHDTVKTRLGDLKFEQGHVAQEPLAEVKGDEVTLHNVRNCDYRTETDYTPAPPELVARVIGQFRDAGCNAR